MSRRTYAQRHRDSQREWLDGFRVAYGLEPLTEAEIRRSLELRAKARAKHLPIGTGVGEAARDAYLNRRR